MQLRNKNHEYMSGDKRLVGVNELLKETGLIKDLEKIIPAPVLEKARIKGTIIHKIAELTLKGTLDESTVDPSLRNQKEQIEQFIKDYQVKPLYIETPIFDEKRMFAGTPDVIAETSHGLAIIDWSSSKAEGHKLQMQAYCILAQTLKLDCENLLEVRLPDSGNYKVSKMKPDKESQLVILSALRVYWFRRQNGNNL